MARTLTIALDVDDVIIDLLGTLVRRYNAAHHVQVFRRLTIEDFTSWNIRECLGDHIGERIYADINDPKVYANAAPVAGALDGIAKLRAAGHRVIFVSSCVSGASADAKLAWLRRHGILADNASALDDWFPVKDKASVRADLLVDDGAHNVRAWPGFALLFDRPHNHATDFPLGYLYRRLRVRDWAEVVAEVLNRAEVLECDSGAARTFVALDSTFVTPREGEKASNPKDIIGANKLPLHLVPATAIAEESLAMLDGCLKYGRDNFRAIGVRASIYMAAAMRHLQAYMEGEDTADDSGATHLGHARACIGIVIDAKYAGKLTDDRKVAGGYARAVAELTPVVTQIRARHADKDPRHYTIRDNAETEAVA